MNRIGQALKEFGVHPYLLGWDDTLAQCSAGRCSDPWADRPAPSHTPIPLPADARPTGIRATRAGSPFGVRSSMTKRMLIDATHAEETRVVVLDGSRLEDFDVETSAKRQLKGNIYLAKVVRVEPSLQAAFVEYGGNRHGFLAFGEIHPDYYQIPVADRQRLIEQEAEGARREEEEDDRAAAESREVNPPRRPQPAETATGSRPRGAGVRRGPEAPVEVSG